MVPGRVPRLAERDGHQQPPQLVPVGQLELADVVRAVEGPIASVRGSRPEDVSYTGAATALQDVWIELRASMRGVLEETSLADLVERSR